LQFCLIPAKNIKDIIKMRVNYQYKDKQNVREK